MTAAQATRANAGRVHTGPVTRSRTKNISSSHRFSTKFPDAPLPSNCCKTGSPALDVNPLPRVASEMALHVLAYNLTRVMNIVGVQPLLAAMRA
jgi:hypothetical protein